MNNYKIAFFTPALDQKSETFVHSQIERFKPILLFHGGWFHNKVNNKKIVRIRHKIRWFFLSEEEIRVKLIFKSLKCEQIDVIIIQYFNTILDNYRWMVNLQLPIIVHFHGFDFSCHAYLNHPLLENGLKLISGAFSVSNSMTKRIKNNKHFPKYIVTQPCPPNISEIEKVNIKFMDSDPNSKFNNVVILGRFTQKKAPIVNVFVIQKVLNLLADLKFNDTIRFHWIGNGEYFEICCELVKQLNLTEYVAFYGAMDHEDALNIMGKCDVFIQNSITAVDGNTEGTPVALLEAGCLGLGVVATKHEGIIDVIEHNGNGFLVDQGDVDNLAKYVVELCIDSEKRLLFGSKLKEKVNKEFNSDIYYNKFDNLIDSVITDFHIA
jgi:colanic acid/amylovoran biosynthesis glycosyltransferase